MGFASFLGSLAGAGISAAGTLESGEANSAMARYQSQVAANDAAIAKQNAQLAGAVGESQAQQSELATRAKAGSIKAAFGANNITVGTGSAANVEQSQREIGMIDSATIRSNAARQAYGYETQAENFGAQSKLESTESQQDIIGAGVGATGSLLSGASSTGQRYASWVQAGGQPPSWAATLF